MKLNRLSILLFVQKMRCCLENEVLSMAHVLSIDVLFAVVHVF